MALSPKASDKRLHKHENTAKEIKWNNAPSRPPRKFYRGVRKLIPGSLAAQGLIETCIACLYSN